MIASVRQFLQDEEGATAVEYGLIAALISVVIITALTQVGSAIHDKFEIIANAIGSAQR